MINICAIFGYLDSKQEVQYRTLKKLVRSLSIESSIRGQDSTGYGYVANGIIKVYKAPLPAKKVQFYFPAKTRSVLGHVRMATKGEPSFNENNHPFSGIAGDNGFILAHNGQIFNDDVLRISKSLPATPIKTDSYIAVQLIEKNNSLNFDSLKSMAETVEGSFAFNLLSDKNELFLVKGDSPIFLVHFERLGLYVYSSTESIFTKAIIRTKLKHEPFTQIPVNSGEILKIDVQGKIEKSTFDNWYNSFMFSRMPYSWSFATNQAPTENTHIDELVELASFVGVSREEITALLTLGFSLFEIQELLSEPDLLREQLCGLYEDDPDFCFDY
jgi:glucosamine--fructose-6-phosphate aminotransferase (isomerizing)